jgi:SAM-dependent methyltransferase
MRPLATTALASFLVLFLELVFIRWLPSNIRLLAYFSNFILLASFLGIGLGCLLAGARRTLFPAFPWVQLAILATVYLVRLEVAAPSASTIYFSSGTTDPVVVVESTVLLPVLFLVTVLLLAATAQRMGREMAAQRPLPAYTANVAGSLAGVVAFALMAWLELSPPWWFAVLAAAAAPLLVIPEPHRPRYRPALIAGSLGALAAGVGLAAVMALGTIWSPYYKLTVRGDGADTVIEVNNIFHQSMAPLQQKEYFYEWPYTVFGDTFENVLVLGAGSGTDVAAALAHGAKRVDAVEIDPAIIRLGRALHPDRPYADPRVRIVNDDARHFLRTTGEQYDLVVFALIDSLTLQSSFSSVRLESYMLTEEAFRAVRDRLSPDGVVVIYNYFREKWLVDRLANTAAAAFGAEPRAHVHVASGYLAVLMAGPRLATYPAGVSPPDQVTAFGHRDPRSPSSPLQRDASVEPATDDWPFLYMRSRQIPRHYLLALAVVLVSAAILVLPAVRSAGGRWSWQFFLLGAGFMLLETKSIIQFALLWGSTWVVASLAIAAVLVMALAANWMVARRLVPRTGIVVGVLVGLLAVSYVVPIGRVTFESRVAESLFYAALMFSPVLCAGLLFGSAIARSTSVARDFGTNLLGAMAGGMAEYLSLVTGYRALIVVVALCYIGAVIAPRPRTPE